MGVTNVGDLMSMMDSGDYSSADWRIGEDNSTQLLANERTNQMQMKIAEATNQANREIHAMDNAFNADQAQLARDFQLDMWNRQNAYNSPEAQKQRMLQAGLNPLSLSGLSSQPVQSSVPSSSQASAAAAIPMQQAQLTAPHLATATRGVDIAAALTNVANGGKGFVDTVVNLGRLKNETSLADTQNALNLAKAFEARQAGKATEINTSSIVPQQLRNMMAEYDEIVAKKNKTNAEETLINEQRKAIGAQIWKWIADYDVALKNVDVLKQRNEIESTGNPWKIGMDFIKRVGLDKKIEDFIKGNTQGSLTEIGSQIARQPLSSLLGAWNTFKGLVSDETLGYGSYPFKPVVWLGETLLNAIDKKLPAKKFKMNTGNSSVLNPVPINGDSYSGQ